MATGFVKTLAAATLLLAFAVVLWQLAVVHLTDQAHSLVSMAREQPGKRRPASPRRANGRNERRRSLPSKLPVLRARPFAISVMHAFGRPTVRTTLCAVLAAFPTSAIHLFTDGDQLEYRRPTDGEPSASDLHGGRLRESLVDLLPCCTVLGSVARATSVYASILAASLDSARANHSGVLVLEDDVLVRKGAEALLGAAVAELDEAHTGEAAFVLDCYVAEHQGADVAEVREYTFIERDFSSCSQCLYFSPRAVVAVHAALDAVLRRAPGHWPKGMGPTFSTKSGGARYSHKVHPDMMRPGAFMPPYDRTIAAVAHSERIPVYGTRLALVEHAQAKSMGSSARAFHHTTRKKEHGTNALRWSAEEAHERC
jgi:hypothetical protein